MTLGGGIFTNYNEVFPGAYINTITLGTNINLYGQRGYVACPMSLSWGSDDKNIIVTGSNFFDRALEFFGYEYNSDELRNIRELLKGSQVAVITKLNTGGAKAENSYFTANNIGTRGNELITVIQLNAKSESSNLIYDVFTYFGTKLVDRQIGIKTGEDLRPNKFATPKDGITLQVTAGAPFTGGTDGTVTAQGYQNALNRLDSAYFNVLVCNTDDPVVKAMFAEYTRNKNDEQGIKFQTVIHKHAIDDKYIISVENNISPDLVYWVGGMSAGVPIGRSLTNAPYTGEYQVSFEEGGMPYINDDYKAFIGAGKFAFYDDAGTPRIVVDINTKTSVTEQENEWFKENQTVRIMQQSAQDKARIFNTLFLGQVPNDDAGRLSLWNRFTSYNQQFLQAEQRAITNYNSADTEVYYIDKKKVGCTEKLVIVNAMEQLYMTTVFI